LVSSGVLKQNLIFKLLAKDKKIVDITAPRASNTTAQEDEPEDDEQVASALRLRMFLSTEDSTEEEGLQEETANEEKGKGKSDGHRF
jgi:hypothetical protein